MSWHTFPCIPHTKRPAITDWERAARPGYGTDSPAYGIACGPSDLVVIDCDTDKITGEHVGMVNFLTLAADHDYFPDTFQVQTPSGGVHFYFRACPRHQVRNRVRRLTLDGTPRRVDGVDVRGAGGYVIGPASDHGTYTVISDAPPAPLPEWLCTAARRPPERDLTGHTLDPGKHAFGAGYGERALENEVKILLGAPVGERHMTLNSCAYLLGQLVASGCVSGLRVAAALEMAACAIGLPVRETRATIMAGLKAGMSTPRVVRSRT